MPNYNENYATFAESFFSSKNNVFKQNNSMRHNTLSTITKEKFGGISGNINLNFGEIEKIATTKHLGNDIITPS